MALGLLGGHHFVDLLALLGRSLSRTTRISDRISLKWFRRLYTVSAFGERLVTVPFTTSCQARDTQAHNRGYTALTHPLMSRRTYFWQRGCSGVPSVEVGSITPPRTSCRKA
ncbi:hypothetical protein EDB19DRAFT_481575 [Suillus lakei]|nr:hypothetical protein EDB19DRAFT_481575 [Suillus lakei]